MFINKVNAEVGRSKGKPPAASEFFQRWLAEMVLATTRSLPLEDQARFLEAISRNLKR